MAHRKASKRSKARTMLRLADLEQSPLALVRCSRRLPDGRLVTGYTDRIVLDAKQLKENITRPSGWHHKRPLS